MKENRLTKRQKHKERERRRKRKKEEKGRDMKRPNRRRAVTGIEYNS